ncbi:PREDICTED: putative F-box protein At1g33020 [Camelina sativa]|uniref:F-box protein At1g33020 n=1 Tax=Camelina sativa TaxID=90675 RepID=A0ABM1R9T1_CAMSA|nr:PREDICTED: putative F-box protein At1g33020 [Camelina sativa]
MPVICNPLTGRYVSLPKLRTNKQSRSFLGFDPVDKQYKVLLMNGIVNYETVHHILTLEAGIMRWRVIQCPFTHKPFGKGICINWVLYYLAEPTDKSSNVIVCFDVKSENFKFIKAKCFYQLVNYKGKLGGITLKYDNDSRQGAHGNVFRWPNLELPMWVLEDVETQKWSEFFFPFPDAGFYKHLSVLGVTATDDIVFSYIWTSNYYVYFSPEMNTLQRVSLGVGDEYGTVNVFVDHIEDLSVNILKSSIFDLRGL